ncbi:ATP-binding protein [Streptomyces rubiginosohelvolus]|uniref:HD domain-containing protein n=1 Tax=Streptomyces rubiginosohelvolus TaxID=67362 RepID=UPI0036A17DF1
MMQPDDASRPDLWRAAFGQDAFTDHANARDKLKRSLLDMEERANQLANEIARDMPEFTQHDSSHTYALWEIANHIAGPKLVLNPAEAFVLGGAILVHDLAMSRAAHQISGQSLRDRREWPDALAGEIRKEYGRSPHPMELASHPEPFATEADKHLLRSLHAEVAEQLPAASWVGQDKNTAYLINDPDVRQAYGRIIGRVAASHHWNSDEVTRVLSSPVGAPSFAPIDWRVDTLVIACLLRTADAAHLDSKRAPDLLAAVRSLPSLSQDHWLFQTRIQRPYLTNGRLVFTAPDGFAADEIKAWWLAYETLSAVDEELRNTDSVLADNGRTTFAARGVANVESPKAFSVVAPCRDWEPVQAQIKVDDVAGLVSRLGGSELYGESWVVALREITTNACDAVKAREALASYRGGRPFAGRVSLWLEAQENRSWLCCGDNGIGMTPSILGGKLLDFGTTSWLSPDVVRENPGLLASKFEPSGRFGIGFFSVFMMGSRVQVVSRSVSGGPADTWVLEFSNGVEHRPILRKATHGEQLDEPGTIIKVQLHEDLDSDFSSLNNGDAFSLRLRVTRVSWRMIEDVTLTGIMRYLMPAAEVDIWTSDRIGGRSSKCAVAAQEWLHMDGVTLMRRIVGLPDNGPDGADFIGIDGDDPWDGKSEAENIAQQVGGRLQVVHDEENRPAGRIAMLDAEFLEDEDFSYPTASIITAGPARTSATLSNVSGILIGQPRGAAREFAYPLASYASMGDWVTSQMEELTALAEGSDREGWSTVVAEMAWRLDKDARHLRCWRTQEGWLDYPNLVRWISKRSSFLVSDHYSFRVEIGPDSFSADLDEDVLAFDATANIRIAGNVGTGWPRNVKHGERPAFKFMFCSAMKESWGMDVATVDQFFRRMKTEWVQAGKFQGRPLVVAVQPFVRE